MIERLSELSAERDSLVAHLCDTCARLDDELVRLKCKRQLVRIELLLVEQEACMDQQEQQQQQQQQQQQVDSDMDDALVKRHAELCAKLAAQDEKMKQLGDEVASTATVGSDELRLVYDELTARRERLRTRLAQRKGELDAAQRAAEFRNNCAEMSEWIGAQRRQLASLLTAESDVRAAHKLDAVHKQLNANRTRLAKLRDEATSVSSSSSTTTIMSVMSSLESSWSELESEALTCGQRVSEASRERESRERLAHLDARLSSLGEQLEAVPAATLGSGGGDLSSVKHALKRHRALVAQLGVERELLDTATRHQSEEDQQQHQEQQQQQQLQSPERWLELAKRIDELDEAARVKSDTLHAELKARETLFQMHNELDWIDEAVRRVAALFFSTTQDATSKTTSNTR